MHTLAPWKMHDMEGATIVAGIPGGEVANCCNGFGDQDDNARHIIKCVNEMAVLENLARDPNVSSEAIGIRIRNNLGK